LSAVRLDREQAALWYLSRPPRRYARPAGRPRPPAGSLLYEKVALVDVPWRVNNTCLSERLLGGGNGVDAQERLNVGVSRWPLS
jgi:hypothetical protein